MWSIVLYGTFVWMADLVCAPKKASLKILADKNLALSRSSSFREFGMSYEEFSQVKKKKKKAVKRVD